MMKEIMKKEIGCQANNFNRLVYYLPTDVMKMLAFRRRLQLDTRTTREAQRFKGT